MKSIIFHSSQARVVMVALFYPVLARGKLSVSPQDCVFVVWAGIYCWRFKYIFFIYVCFIIMFVFSKYEAYECNM